MIEANRNNTAPPPPFPLPAAPGAAGRFGRPWLATRGANPLQSLPGASQLSTGGSYGTAARARTAFRVPGLGGSQAVVDPATASSALALASQQQHQDPGALVGRGGQPGGAFLPPWSQPSQPEFDHPTAWLGSGQPDPSEQPPALGSSGAFAEPLFPHSQPSQVAARLLEELQGKSAPAAAPVDDSAPLLRDILTKLESLEESHSKLAGAVAGVEGRLGAAAAAAAEVPPSEDQLDRVLGALEAMQPGAAAMAQVLHFLEAAGRRPPTAEMATQTSPLAPAAVAAPDPGDGGSPRVATGSSRPLGARPGAAFSGLRAVPLAGHKRARQAASSGDDSDDELDVSPRVARRVQRHRQMRAGKAARR